VQALDEALISGIGFDCLASKSPTDDHPFRPILDRPNVIVTPHVAWASQVAMQACWNQVIDNVENFHRGQPSNVVS
jgi:glycerate dehydrogenase